MTEREIGVEVKSSLNLPSVREMRVDIEKLREMQRASKRIIAEHHRQVEAQKKEREKLIKLTNNSVDQDGVRYNADACQQAADRCFKHIGMFKALAKKEQAKIKQIDGMIAQIEERICLSEQISL